MGEHADDAIDDLLFGYSSHDDDNEYNQGVICRNCGSAGLYWDRNELTGKFWLRDPYGDWHKCNKKK